MLLRDMVFDGHLPNMRVDPAWWEPKHPQERLPAGDDPVQLWRPSPEVYKITAPVLTGDRVGASINYSWTPATSGMTKIRGYELWVQKNDDDPELVISEDNTYDMFGGLLTELLAYDEFEVEENTVYRAYVIAKDVSGHSVQSNVVEHVVTDISAELVMMIPGAISASSGSVTLTYDLVAEGVQPGDAMIWVGSYGHGGSSGGNSPGYNATVVLPEGWKRITSSTRSSRIHESTFDTRMVTALWKNYAEGDAFEMTATHNTRPYVMGTLYVFRNARRNPISYFALRSLYSETAYHGYVASPMIFPNEAGSMLAVHATYRGTEEVFADVRYSHPPVAVEHNVLQIAGGDNANWRDHTVVWSLGQNEIENLLINSFDNDFAESPWELSGLFSQNYLDQGAGYRLILGANGGNTEHCIKQTLQFEEGVPVTISARMDWNNSNAGRAYIRVEDGENTYACHFPRLSGTAGLVGSLDTEGDLEFAGFGMYDAGYTPVFLTFVPKVTGPHVISLGRSKSLSYTWDSTSDSSGLTLMMAKAYRGRYPMSHHPSVQSLDAVTEGLGAAPRVIYNDDKPNIGGCVAFEVTARANQPSRLLPHDGSLRMEPGSYLQSDDPAFYRLGHRWMRLDRHACPPSWDNGPGRYYVEVEFDSLSCWSNNPGYPGVYVAPLDGFAQEISENIVTLDANQVYGFTSHSGSTPAFGWKLVANGSDAVAHWLGTSGVQLLPATVGIAIDYHAGTVVVTFKNATMELVSDPMTLVDTEIPYQFVCNVGLHSTSQSARMRVNATGPFLMKPEGYSAWDYLHEVE